jgi:2-polyprenyl-6-methoxyphenol hydroxylase-like FAD-dependent oxidoreductase
METGSSLLEKLQFHCCIAGGGPAGIMLGYLLARAGIEVLVLEKHADFLRDFRGDTVHPSTLQVMHELGLLEAFLKRPHQKVAQVRARIGGEQIMLGNMAYLRTQCRFMALMPQWDFLDFLAQQGRRYPTFQLRMQTEVTGLIESNGRIVGVQGKTLAGPVEVRADLVVGADGRDSLVRDCSGLEIEDLGTPVDALWMRLSKRSGDPEVAFLADHGKLLVLFDRGDYWQCGFPILKGSGTELQRGGIENFREGIAEVAPFLRDRVEELRDWNDVKLLTVRVNRLRRWHRAGLLCIGDAAHAMSPVGGIGINLAIQDAVAAANVLAGPLREAVVSDGELAKIQRRRAFPTRLTQRLQELLRRQVGRGFGKPRPARPPWPIRLLERTGLLCRLRTRFVGVGIRPEHVKTPDVYK